MAVTFDREHHGCHGPGPVTQCFDLFIVYLRGYYCLCFGFVFLDLWFWSHLFRLCSSQSCPCVKPMSLSLCTSCFTLVVFSLCASGSVFFCPPSRHCSSCQLHLQGVCSLPCFPFVFSVCSLSRRTLNQLCVLSVYLPACILSLYSQLSSVCV